MANQTPKNNRSDMQELENAFDKLANKGTSPKSGRYAKSRDDKIVTVLIICISAVLLLAIAGGIVLYNLFLKDITIPDSVSFMGISLDGMSGSKARKTIEQEFLQKFSELSITLDIEGESLEISASDISAAVDIDKIINDIVSGSYRDSISSYLSIDRSAILKKIKASLPPVEAPLVPSNYTVEGVMPESFEKIDEAAAVKLHITKGTPGKSLDEEGLLQSVYDAFSAQKKTVQFQYTLSDVEALDFHAISAEVCVQPLDAVYDKENYQISGGTFGYLFDIQEAADALSQAEYGESIEISYKWVEPEITLDELNEELFQDQLATYTTKAGWDSSRNVNLKLACEAINGIVMNPGDTFSYNGTLGERTAEKGYQLGASYVGGETVYDYGGGICQVSSTLYYCTVVSDLEIVERECHGYASSYIPLSMDATVFWGGLDYKFKNNSEYPIRIEAYAEGGNVTVSIYGTDYKDYYVKFEYEHIDTYPFEVIYKEMKADNEKGYEDGDVITSAYTGYKSKGYRVKYDKQTNQEIERILESTDVYSKRDRVICKIVDGETEPSETAPSESTDPTEPEQPTVPTPSEPIPTNSTQPAPTEPAPTSPEPAPTEAAPTEPSPTQSTPTEPESAETESEISDTPVSESDAE